MARKKTNQLAQEVNKKADSGIKKLKILFTIVNRSKALFLVDLLEEYEVNMQMVLYGKGTASEEMLKKLVVPEVEKAVIISVIKAENEKEILETIEEKFEKVKFGKGIAYTVPMKSIIGVSMYRFLCNERSSMEGRNNG